jgi:hypothetical protein
MREAPASRNETLPPRLYAVMATTMFATFGALVAGYQLLFPGPFA